jgi:FolB domain-containing protein
MMGENHLERVIGIEGLEVSAFIGVPEEERAIAQSLLLDLRFAAMIQPGELHDDISFTVDYDAVSRRVAEIVTERPRKLIETLADELTLTLLQEFSLRWIEITVRKFILPQTESVSVSMRRESPICTTQSNIRTI